MIVHRVVLDQVGLLWFGETNKLDWGHSPLVEQLEETVLAVGAWLSKIDDSCVVCDDFTLLVHSFSVTFHVELLDVRGKFAESLAVGYNGSWGITQDRSVVEAYQTKHKRNIFLRSTEKYHDIFLFDQESVNRMATF